MRIEKSVPLDPIGPRIVTLRELTVPQVRQILEQLRHPDGMAFVGSLLDGDPAPLLALLGDCVELAPECGAISFSELAFLAGEFQSMHSSFFAQAAMQNLIAAAGIALTVANLTAPAASSLNEDTQT